MELLGNDGLELGPRLVGDIYNAGIDLGHELLERNRDLAVMIVEDRLGRQHFKRRQNDND